MSTLSAVAAESGAETSRAGAEALLEQIRRFEDGQATALDVHYCYRLLLRRQPDPTGWTNNLALIRQGVPPETFVENFLGSAEYQARAKSDRSTLVQLEGYAMFVAREDQLIGRFIAATKTYEPHVTKTVRRVLGPDDVFLDIGANMGWFTLLAANITRHGRLSCFHGPRRRND